MLTSDLNKIAAELNGKYTIENTKISFTDGSRSPETYHKISYKYQQSDIFILIQTGFTETAKVSARLPQSYKNIPFEINTISPFENLFLRKTSRFKVKCKNQNFKQFLEIKALPIFDKMMEAQNFSPRIFSENLESANQIVLEFHLGFPKWREIFSDIHLFLISVTDELNTNS